MNPLKTISAVALALFVLVSSTSFVIGVHFCMGEVQKIALFTKADDCKKHQDVPPCHRKAETACCSDQIVIHDGDDMEAFEKAGVSPILSLEEAQPLAVLVEIAPPKSLLKTNFYHYRPPLRSIDLIVEHRVFLI